MPLEGVVAVPMSPGEPDTLRAKVLCLTTTRGCTWVSPPLGGAPWQQMCWLCVGNINVPYAGLQRSVQVLDEVWRAGHQAVVHKVDDIFGVATLGGQVHDLQQHGWQHGMHVRQWNEVARCGRWLDDCCCARCALLWRSSSRFHGW